MKKKYTVIDLFSGVEAYPMALKCLVLKYYLVLTMMQRL